MNHKVFGAGFLAFANLNEFMYCTVLLAITMLTGYGASLVYPPAAQKLDGLTVWTLNSDDPTMKGEYEQLSKIHRDSEEGNSSEEPLIDAESNEDLD